MELEKKHRRVPTVDLPVNIKSSSVGIRRWKRRGLEGRQ